MPFDYPGFIFGIHDPGDWMQDVEAARKQGWVLVTEELGNDPNDIRGGNYANLANRGFRVIVRLNNGYGNTGTIPNSSLYANFARRCRNFVANSQGADSWIIGNEMNASFERPGGASGEVITPSRYAQCYTLCRNEIKSLNGHDTDQVVVGAVGPYNADTGGTWIQYFRDMLEPIKNACDGISIHAYTHGADPNLIFSERRFGNLPDLHFDFRTYRDFMAAIPPELRDKPVYLTEAQPAAECNKDGWLSDQTRGWIQNAYKEINDWNADPNNQPIQTLLLFRWSDANCDAWRMDDKDWLKEDFRQVLKNDYRVVRPRGAGSVQPARVYRATFISDDTPASMVMDGEARTNVVVKNDGNFVWRADGTTGNPVRFGFRWFNAAGQLLPTRDSPRTPLPRDIQPGEQVTLSNVRIIAPPNTGPQTLRLDLVEEGVQWFSDAGSPARNKTVTVRMPDVAAPSREYAFSVINANIPASFPRDASTAAVLTLRNDGTRTWNSQGANPVTLGFKWFRPGAMRETLVRRLVRASLPRDVPKGDTVTVSIPVLAPFSPGAYNLVFDLVEEGITEFGAKGAQPFVRLVTVTAPPYYVSWKPLNVPSPLKVDQTRNLTVGLTNDGGKTWIANGDRRVRLAYYWINRRGQRLLLKQDIRASLPRDIAPGEAVDVSIDLLTPDSPGNLTLRFDLVEEGVTFFADQGSPPLDKSVTVQGVQEFQVSFGDIFPVVAPAAPFKLNLRIRNDGTSVWAAGGRAPVKVGYHWFDGNNQPVPVAQDTRTPLPADLMPGDEVVVSATGFAPDKPGRYRLQWSLVAEGRAWFYDLKARTLDMTVEVLPVGAPAPRAQEVLLMAEDTPYRANFTPIDLVVSMEASAQRVVTFKVRNDGNRTWVKGGNNPVHVGYRWYQGSEQIPVAIDVRTELPADMEPGQEAAFGAIIVAPPVPDIYTLRIDLVEEGVTWFDDTGTSRPLEFAVQVTQSTQAVKIQTSDNDELAPLAVNGDPGTAWTSSKKMEPGMWVQVDMGATRTIDAVAVRSGGTGMPAGYEVLVSADGANWLNVGSRERNFSDVAITFAPVPVRYIRIVQTGEPQWSAPWKVAEIAVHDAALWRAIASHNADQTALAFDNDPQTMWTSGIPQQPGMFFTLDLGQAQTVTGIALDNGAQSEYPSAYLIQTSPDGQTWTVVAASPEGGNFAPVNATFPPVLARYVSIECTASNRFHAWAISQLWVQRTVTDWQVLKA